MNVEVRNNPAKYRYELWVDGEGVGHAKYRLGHGRIAFVHTKVYEPHESLGLGTQLARVALDDARARGRGPDALRDVEARDLALHERVDHDDVGALGRRLRDPGLGVVLHAGDLRLLLAAEQALEVLRDLREVFDEEDSFHCGRV